MRVQLDLLLAEQVMVVAKETSAAVDHSDEFASYTNLLFTNLLDISLVFNHAFGSTSAQEFAKLWSVQDNDLVDYGIGVVTHDDAKSSAAMSDLTRTFVPQFTDLAAGMFGLPPDQITALMTEQLDADKAFMDDLAAQRYGDSYSQLDAAYFQTARQGDLMAERITQKFSDRYPGDAALPAVDRRVSLNLLLQQHALLATMATDAALAKRDADRTAATAALRTNEDAISRSLHVAGFDRVWSARLAALAAYAQMGDAASRQVVVATGPQLASVAGVPLPPVRDELTALLNVIDDQRAQDWKTVGDDDRAAATSMQPVADAMSGVVQS